MSEQLNIVEPQVLSLDGTPVVKPGELYRILPNGKWEFFFDHHIISCFSRCEQEFYYRHILHRAPKGGFGFAAELGIWWAKAMELYYAAMQKGDLTKALAMEIAAHAWTSCKCDALKDKFPSSFETFGGRNGVIIMIGQYYDATFLHDSVNWKIVSVEAGFGLRKEVKLCENDKVIVYLTGRPDMHVVEQNRLIPIDHKTIDHVDYKTPLKWKPHPQTAGYICATEIIAKLLGLTVTGDRTIINIACRKEPAEKPRNGKPKASRFLRPLAVYSQAELEEFRDRVARKAARLRYCIENNEWLWNESACHLYNGCDFRPVDAQAPDARLIILEASYEQVEPWSPYEVEE